MILPNKYVPLKESYIGISSLILDTLRGESLHVDELWGNYKIKYSNFTPSYIKFVHVLTFMFSCGMISYTERGEIFNENLKLEDN